MAAFSYTLPAVRGVQAGREYFVSMCPLQLVPVLFRLEQTGIRPELQLQRVLNTARIPEITRYLVKHPKSYVLSSLTGSVNGDVQFEPLAGSAGPATLGHLRIPMTAKLLLHDGLHRRAAIEAALKDKPELGEETISLVLFVDPGLRRAEQMFTDLNRNETRSARSRSIAGDHRDEMARLVKALVSRVPVFAGLTEMARSTISNRSLKLFTLSGIYHATRTLLADQEHASFSGKLTLASEFWSEVAGRIPEWQQARTGDISPAELRRDYVHVHAIGLAALARVGRALLQKHPASWKSKLRLLRTLNWRRDNCRLWEGRAMIGGRLSKATTCVVLTGNAIKQHLGLPLTDEEQDAEGRLNSRQ